jgi:hypothetical protein
MDCYPTSELHATGSNPLSQTENPTVLFDIGCSGIAIGFLQFVDLGIQCQGLVPLFRSL